MVSKLIWPTRTENVRERQAFRRQQNDDNFEKANKVVGGTEDNIVTLTADGDIQDSGKSFDDVILKKRNTVTVFADYTVLEINEIIWVDATAGPVTITLFPAATIQGQTFEIQKIDSSNNATTVVGDGSETINGQASVILNRQKDYIKPTSTGSSYLA